MLSRYMMTKIIRENGHLVLEGGEKTEELRQACIFLRTHFLTECRLRSGTPIEVLIPDITVLAPGRAIRARQSAHIADVIAEL